MKQVHYLTGAHLPVIKLREFQLWNEKEQNKKESPKSEGLVDVFSKAVAGEKFSK